MNHRTCAGSAHSKIRNTKDERRKAGIPNDEDRMKNDEEMTKDGTGIDRARRRKTKADTENNRVEGE